MKIRSLSTHPHSDEKSSEADKDVIYTFNARHFRKGIITTFTLIRHRQLLKSPSWGCQKCYE